jgi:hypothetical protein
MYRRDLGASGGLTRRKLLPALYHLKQSGLLTEDVGRYVPGQSWLGRHLNGTMYRPAHTKAKHKPYGGRREILLAPMARIARKFYSQLTSMFALMEICNCISYKPRNVTRFSSVPLGASFPFPILLPGACTLMLGNFR